MLSLTIGENPSRQESDSNISSMNSKIEVEDAEILHNDFIRLNLESNECNRIQMNLYF